MSSMRLFGISVKASLYVDSAALSHVNNITLTRIKDARCSWWEIPPHSNPKCKWVETKGRRKVARKWHQMSQNRQRHWYNPSEPPTVKPSVHIWTHTRTNSANKSNSAVHRRLTKMEERGGALSRCFISDSISTAWIHSTLIFGHCIIKVLRYCIIPIWCFSHQSCPAIIIADTLSCTNPACHKTLQWTFSNTSRLQYHQISPYLLQTWLA